MPNITLHVKGMSCNHCVNSIEGALREIGAGATVNLEESTVAVEFDDSKLTIETIKETIEEQGYTVV